MANLIIADAEVELVPWSIARHTAVRSGASRRKKRPEECLLDSSVHYQAMRSLPDGGRRGRPDISHFCLLLALDSIPGREGRLRTYLHTRNNRVMEFDPSVRLPKNYSRFQGLMEEALTTGGVKAEAKQLIRVHEESLPDLLLRLGGKTVLLSEKGRRLSDFSRLSQCNIAVGGFPHGDFISNLDGVAFDALSLYDAPLMAWTSVSIVTAHI